MKLLFLRNQQGQGMMEYIIISTLVGIVCLATVKSYGGVLKRKIDVMKNHINKELSLEK